MKRYEVKLNIKAHDVLDDWSVVDVARALKEDIHYESLGQLDVEYVEVEEMTE